MCYNNDYRMSKRETSLFAADKSAEAKSFFAFCNYIIVTEIDKFLFEICLQIKDLRSKYRYFDFRLSLLICMSI